MVSERLFPRCHQSHYKTLASPEEAERQLANGKEKINIITRPSRTDPDTTRLGIKSETGVKCRQA